MTPRADVRLRPVTAADAPAMYRWMCDPVVADNIGLQRVPSLEATEAWIAGAQAAGIHAFAVILGERHVGNVVLDRVDIRVGSARLSVYIGEADARGGGVGTSAVRRVLEAAFGSLGLHRVWLTVHAENAPAIASYRKLGLRVEGLLRDDFWLAGRRVDALIMSILAPEFAP